MGFSLAWMAMKDTDADAACAALGMERKGGGQPYPDYEFSGAALPGGWYLAVGDRSGYEFIAHNDHAALSAARDVIVCEVEEHVMSSSAALWRGGACLWKVIHESDNGRCHLEVEGEPPAEFESVRAEYLAKQDAEGGEDADVDYIFEVPLRLAQDIAGFKHDETPAEGPEPRFEKLALRKGVKRPKDPEMERAWKLWRMPREDRPPLWSWPFIWLLLWYVQRDEKRGRRR
ncbi:MAG: hypothetical protein OEZ03_13855 [Alphaproteobacteria bacterium]|nr:hypothetical protein [Alphaproteobacteria bacterium]